MKSLPLALAALLLAPIALAQMPARPAAGPGLTLVTPDIPDGSIIPPKFTQLTAHPVSPALAWSHVPAGVVSFVMIMHDPDTAPHKKSEDILHWMAFNIPGTAAGLPENLPTDASLPDGTIQPKNYHGTPGYMGPGAGAAGPYHHYTWELYALDLKLDLGPDATRADVLKAIDGHVLAKAATSARFHR
ncbi:MAG TPA: YbhB/YbcL family Raf kinase inhibitor-like protein [Opitutaceae bacterium]|jgi:hypothetical protein|nr:YbhB/YbcL family Raf kinase inhibitor-like protein [Opitutaceae bacterium]